MQPDCSALTSRSALVQQLSSVLESISIEELTAIYGDLLPEYVAYPIDDNAVLVTKDSIRGWAAQVGLQYTERKQASGELGVGYIYDNMSSDFVYKNHLEAMVVAYGQVHFYNHTTHSLVDNPCS